MSGEGPAIKQTREESEKKTILDPDILVVGSNGVPYIQITCAAAELIPTVQYGNCSVGPIIVKRWVEDTGVDDLKKEIRATQSLCEEAVAEDRQTVHALTRQSTEGRYNQ